MSFRVDARLSCPWGCLCTFFSSMYDPVLSDHHRSWGNTPAIDIINFDLNEVENERDFSLAFIGVF